MLDKRHLVQSMVSEESMATTSTAEETQEVHTIPEYSLDTRHLGISLTFVCCLRFNIWCPLQAEAIFCYAQQPFLASAPAVWSPWNSFCSSYPRYQNAAGQSVITQEFNACRAKQYWYRCNGPRSGLSLILPSHSSQPGDSQIAGTKLPTVPSLSTQARLILV